MRGDNASSLVKVRSAIEWAIAKAYEDKNIAKISAGTSRGGSTLFELTYCEEKAYLTKLSQLYLETAIQGLDNVYRIEKSLFAEYCHVEAELDFH